MIMNLRVRAQDRPSGEQQIAGDNTMCDSDMPARLSLVLP